MRIDGSDRLSKDVCYLLVGKAQKELHLDDSSLLSWKTPDCYGKHQPIILLINENAFR